MTTSCWVSLLRTKGIGYVELMRGKQRAYLHRGVWEEINGALSNDMELHHVCGDKRCYNPRHLLPVGSLAHHWLHRSTHCQKGHSLQDAYVTVLRDGKRVMRACRPCRTAARHTGEYKAKQRIRAARHAACRASLRRECGLEGKP